MSGYDDVPPEDPYEAGPAKVDEHTITEQSVLGGMMLSKKACADVLGILRASDFTLPRHELIYIAIAELASFESPTDVVAVTDELIRTGDLQRAGGIDYLHSLTSVVPTASNAGYYAGIVRNAATARGLAAIGHRLQSGDGAPGVRLADALNELSTLRDETASGETARLRMLRDVLDVAPEEDVYDWVIPNVVERRDRFMLTAGEGVGKSVMLRQMAVLPAAGIHPFEFNEVTPIRSLVIDVENSERQWRRAIRGMADQAAQRGSRDPRDHVAVEFLPKSDITQAQILGDLHRRIDEVQPDLVVIGPLYRLAPAIKDEDDAAPVLAALDSIRERGVAMLIEAHAGHATSGRGGERDLRPRGSSALLGWPEFGVGIRRDREVGPGGFSRYSLLRWRGDRDARPLPKKFLRGSIWPWEPTY